MSQADASLRVVVRARPMNARETKEGARKCVEYYENTAQIIINGAATYAYDKVFPDTIDQETVYEQTAMPLLDRVFSGFNATILAYGQTGSGKTYTMGTEDKDGTDEIRRGIIPRLIDSIFARIAASGYAEAYKVTVSMFEVYGENVFDLLIPDKVKLNVHGDEKGCTIVNLTTVSVNDLKGAMKLLATGCHNRTKGSTAMNASSSRSHAVFTITVEKTSVPDSDQAFSAKLKLVDLAGSERLKKTEAEGNRMREGISINAGLLILAQVISALVAKQQHVPYRNSVITRVLQDSLGGNSYTVFLACISPADTNSQETLNTLRYADRAKQIKNKPIVNKNPKAEEISVLQAQLASAKKEIAELRSGAAPGMSHERILAQTAEIITLKEEIAKKDEELRDHKMKLMDAIVRNNTQINRMARLESANATSSAAISEIMNVLKNDDNLTAHEMIDSIRKSMDIHVESVENAEEEAVDDTQIVMDDTLYDTDRLPALQAELDEIEKQIELKDGNLEKEMETQRQMIEAMQQGETEKTQLVQRIGELETEISKLRSESKKATTASKLAEERRQKLKELERQHEHDKKRLAELKRLQDTRKRMEESLRKTEEELKNLKTQRARLLKEQRAEGNRFAAFKRKTEREMEQMKSRMQKRENDAVRQKRIDAQRFAVLQQRLAESNRANKQLRELNQKRANRRGATTTTGGLASVQSMIEEEFELERAAAECQFICVELRRQRRELQQQVDKLEAQKFEGSTKRRRTMDPDVSVVLDGEEEFEEERKAQLDKLRANIAEISQEIADLLKNSTITGGDDEEEEKTGTRTSKFANIPADVRPAFEMVYNQALAFMKKEIELNFQLKKQENAKKEWMESKEKQFQKKRDEMDEIHRKYRELCQNVEEAKSGLHSSLSFLLCLIKEDKVDANFFAQFETLRNQFCDVDQKLKKARRRTTCGLTPKAVLKREERSRKGVSRYGNVVNTETLTFDDSIRLGRHQRGSSRSALELNKETDDNVRRRVAMSPIRLDEETKLWEEDEENEEPCNSTFVRAPSNDRTVSPSPPPLNGTFVVTRKKADADDDVAQPSRRKQRRTDGSMLGPL